ncbi:MAG TPA: sulfatase-like hydrolase/transferase [Candidatus Acidoferrales bacterium]|nr:sulfatase-like hydrolase/transferase [Candidatus Acidoferrales bacterium]
MNGNPVIHIQFRMMSLRILLTGLPVVAAVQFSVIAQSHPMPRRDNIILIVADGLAANDLSCYGQTQFQTPHLDQLAAGGIRFTNYFAGGVAGPPARAALMLGKDTSRLSDADFSLTSHDVTVAELLKSSGYSTCLIGEWNLGDENSPGAPWRQGFDEFAGYFDPADAQNVYPDFLWKYDVTYNPSENRNDVFNGRETLPYNLDGKKQGYVPDLLVQWTINDAQNHQPDQFNHYQPFFVAVNETIPGNGNREVSTDAPFSEEPWPQAEKNRAATIARLDAAIGKLLGKLSSMDEISNTVIFLTSDTVPKKGGGIDPKFFHENSGPDDLRVPFIVYCPGKIPAGQVSGVPCSARDFLPTTAALAYVQTPKESEGTSLLPYIFGREAKRH